jgi:Mce-associated membrane protein
MGLDIERILVRDVRLGLAALTLAALVSGGWLLHSASGTPALRNRAFTGTENATAAQTTLTAQITQDLAAVFSYNYADPGTTNAAADQVLTGEARRQYRKLMSPFTGPGGALAHSVLSTTVTATGITSLDASGDHAHLVVSAQETAQTIGQGNAAPASSTAVLGIDATREGGQWRISAITTFH